MTTTTPSLPKPVPASALASAIVLANAARRSKKLDDARALPKNAARVLRCRANPDHIGIIFLEGVDPLHENVIHGGMWIGAGYHEDPTQAFFGRSEQLVCSECLLANAERVVVPHDPITDQPPELGFCFRVPSHLKRFVRTVSLDELKAYMPAAEPAPEPVKPPPPKNPTTPSKEETK